jgi:hypothetical protein
MCNTTIEMYAPVYAKNGDLKHSQECEMAFGRKDPKCPRCQELLNGAEKRDGWQAKYYDKSRQWNRQ